MKHVLISQVGNTLQRYSVKQPTTIPIGETDPLQVSAVVLMKNASSHFYYHGSTQKIIKNEGKQNRHDLSKHCCQMF